eukprot:gene33923-43828_t
MFSGTPAPVFANGFGTDLRERQVCVIIPLRKYSLSKLYVAQHASPGVRPSWSLKYSVITKLATGKAGRRYRTGRRIFPTVLTIKSGCAVRANAHGQPANECPERIHDRDFEKVIAVAQAPVRAQQIAGSDIDLAHVMEGEPQWSRRDRLGKLKAVNVLKHRLNVLWGSQHVVIKSALSDYPSTSLLNMWRFAISSLLFIQPISRILTTTLSSPGSANLPLLKAGAELGVYTFMGFAFQSIGLESTTASRSAFLLYLNVKIVPFLSAVFYRRAIPLSTWISAFLALCDLWCVLAAVSSAMFILRLGDFSARFDPAEINGTSFFTVFLLCALWVGGDMAFHHPMSLADSSPDLGTISVSSPAYMIPQVIQVFLSNPWPVIYLGGITTGLCNYLQTIGQRSISAEKAAIIYSMDPVYGAVFSRVFLNEQLGSQGYLGAGYRYPLL